MSENFGTSYDDRGAAGNDRSDWPIRPWILSALLAICGFLFWAMAGQYFDSYDIEPEQYRYALGAFFVFGGLITAFAIEKYRWLWSIGFGLLSATVLAGVAYSVAGYSPRGFGWDWAFGAGVIAIIIATPLFQTLRDNPEENRFALAYNRLHFYSWSDAVIGASAQAFTGLSWLLLVLISQLFQLIGIDIINILMEDETFGWAFSGAAFGAALGILRENDRIFGLLQNVVLIILSVLAPFLAAALGIFLVSLIFTGLDNLWQSTRSTTPILISCAAGAVVLANAIIRNSEGESSRSKLLKLAAIILAFTILPLAVIAAISTGLRIDQHGLSPERIWALLVVAIATAYGLAYLVSAVRAIIARNAFGWTGFVRAANIKLAIGLCFGALFLSLPLIDFGAVSARDQVARLDAGDVSEEEFDYFSLANDFGPTGLMLAKKMAMDKGSRGKLAQNGLDAESRWDYQRYTKKPEKLGQIILNDPEKALPEALRTKISNSRLCKKDAVCTIVWDQDDRIILLRKPCSNCAIRYSSYTKENKTWRKSSLTPSSRKDELNKDSEIEIRDVTKRQIFVNGKPLGVGF